MALCRILNSNLTKLIFTQNTTKSPKTCGTAWCLVTQERHFRKGYGRVLRVMKYRRKLIGPDRVRKRSDNDNWNYKAELYAFSRRLHENISEETLRCAFIHESYIQSEEQKRRDLDIPIQDVPLNLESNAKLVGLGQNIASNYIKRYLRYCFQLLPEEGIIALHDHLLSDSVLGHVSFNLGTKDLILCSEYPPVENTLASTLLAIVGSIATDNNVSIAENFVLDFICMQLIGKDVFEIWDLKDPSAVLNAILQKHDMTEYEPRLIFESGRNTLESIYNVGLYSDRVFLGQGPGETLAIAEEMAVFNCLRKMFQIRELDQPFSSKQIPEEGVLSRDTNLSVENWYCENLKKFQSL